MASKRSRRSARSIDNAWQTARTMASVSFGLTSSAALEYAPRGIRINAVCPGTIATPMVTDMIDKGELDRDAAIADQPINRLGEPEEIGSAAPIGDSFLYAA